MTRARVLALSLCLSLQSVPGLGQGDSSAVFSLEIPASSFRMAGNGSATLPPGNPTHLQIHVNLPAGQIGYGNIFARINTESAAVIMTTSATTTGVNCDFDLTRRQGFRLKPGRNSVEIGVQDLRGRLRYASFLLDISSQTPEARAAAPVAVPTGERYAVVLGISRYRAATSGVKNLAFSDRDAASIRDFLVSPEGGYRADDVALLLNEDATLGRIREALANVSSRATADDLVAVFVSGHGVSDPDDPRKNYLLAHDSRPGELAETALPFSEIEDFYGRTLKAKAAITFLDVAHANALARAVPGANTLVHQYLMRYAAGGARGVLAAADVGQSAFESNAAGEQRSMFARFLLQGLRGAADPNRDGTVTFGELKTYVREQVRGASGGQQSPTGTLGDGDAIALAGLRARAKD
jgi:hypothetical protein